MDILGIILLVTFIIWLVTAYAPGIPAWGSRVALAIWMGCATLMLLGVEFASD